MSILNSSVLSDLGPIEITAFVLFICALKIFLSIYRYDPNPSKLPVVGIPSGIFGRLRATQAVLSNTPDIITEGYNRYHKSQNPTAFLAPWILTKYVHVIPPSLIAEHTAAPERILSQVVAFHDENGHQSMGGTTIVEAPYHVPLIRTKLTASLPKVMGPMAEELKMAFVEEWDNSWGNKKDANGWVDVALFDDAMKIVSRTSNRVFGGTSICRNKAFLKNATDYSVGIIMVGFGVQAVPKSLLWLLEPVISYRNRRRIAFAMKTLGPMIAERKAIIEHNARADNKEDELALPEDVLQYVIHDALKLGPPHDSVHQITSRYLIINFAAIHTTSLTFTHSLANMAETEHSDPVTGRRYWDLLREEVLAVDRESEEGPGIWTKRKLNKLIGLDSFIRETLRMNITGAVGLVRKVMPKEGYTFSNGLHINEGELVGIPSLNVHYDDCSGDKAKFNGFRFSRPYQELSAQESSAIDQAALGGVGKLAAVMTGDQFLSFGHGKHACPGRFFGITEVKLFIQHCLVNYEIQQTTKAPPQWLWGNQIPPFYLSVKMRKRRAD